MPEYWLSQILVRAASPTIYPALVAAVRKSGFIYYKSVSEAFRAQFKQNLREEYHLPPLEGPKKLKVKPVQNLQQLAKPPRQ